MYKKQTRYKDSHSKIAQLSDFELTTLKIKRATLFLKKIF